MSESHSQGDRGEHGREQRMSALFANLIIQQTNMALMLLGQVPNPETGERVQDLEAARLFIDQLEMLEAKTKGNLDKREEQLLKQSLTTLRMAFVEAVQAPASQAKPDTTTAAQTSTPPAGAPVPPSESPPSSAPEEEHRKKFSKKY